MLFELCNDWSIAIKLWTEYYQVILLLAVVDLWVLFKMKSYG